MKRDDTGNKNDVVSEDSDSDSDHNVDSGHVKKEQGFEHNLHDFIKIKP